MFGQLRPSFPTDWTLDVVRNALRWYVSCVLLAVFTILVLMCPHTFRHTAESWTERLSGLANIPRGMSCCQVETQLLIADFTAIRR